VWTRSGSGDPSRTAPGTAVGHRGVGGPGISPQWTKSRLSRIISESLVTAPLVFVSSHAHRRPVSVCPRCRSLALTVLLAAGAVGLFGACSSSSDKAPSDPSRQAIDGVGEPAWVEDAVVYEVFIPDASKEGTFRGLIDRLGEIEEMGVTTLWLMPIHPIGEKRRKDEIGPLGSPYSIRDYYGVNPNYGTKEDFRALVDSVHARDMHLILDLVANHTAWDHPWLTQNPEIYTSGPMNGFTVPVMDGDTTDWTDVVDLDYEHPQTRQSMIDIMQYWVREFDVDGYRCDVAGAVPRDFWNAAIDSVEKIKPVLMLAEDADPAMHDVGFDYTYAWPYYAQLKEVWAEDRPVSSLTNQVATTRTNLPPAAERLRFTTNHDESMWDATPPELFGGIEGSKAAFVLSSTLPGVPLLYNGQELGVKDTVSFFARTKYEWSESRPIRSFYRTFITLYRNHPALQGGELTVHTPDATDVLVYSRTEDGREILIAVNVRGSEKTVGLPDAYRDAALVDAVNGGRVQGDSLVLGAYDYRLLDVDA